jgi:hypothetical protein
MKKKIGFYILVLEVISIMFLPIYGVTGDSIKNEHPRIWLTNEVDIKLKARITANTREWQDLKAACLTAINGTPYAEYAYLPGLALAYRLTKDTDPTFATNARDEAIKLMDGITASWLPSSNKSTNRYYYVDTGEEFTWVGGESAGYDIRFRGVYLALAYDWLYDYLSTDTSTETWVEPDNTTHVDITKKQKYEFMMNRWIDWYDVKGYNRNITMSDFFAGYFAAKVYTALTTYYETSSASVYYDDIMNRLYPMVLADYNTLQKGGDFVDGQNYGYLVIQNMAGVALAFASATGENFTTNFTWLSEVVDFRTHSIYPDWKYQYSNGAWSSGNTGFVSKVSMMALSELFQSEETSEKAQFYLNHAIGSSISYYDKVWEFLWWDPTRPTLDYRTDDNRSYFASGTGWLSMRSDWTENATYIAIQAGGHLEGQGGMNKDKGHFAIFKNGHLAVTGGAWQDSNGSNMSKATQYENTFLIGTQGSAVMNAGWNCPVKFEDKGDFVYVQGDITDAYIYSNYSKGNHVKNLTRSYVYFRPDYFVVFDRVETDSPTLIKTWQLHTDDPAVIIGDNFDVVQVSTGAKMFGKMLLPASDNRSTSVIPDGTKGSSYDFTISNTINEAKTNFLNVMVMTEPSPTIARIDGTTLVGAQIADKVVMFSKEETELSAGQFNITGSGIYRTIITDLIPNTNYSVTVDGNSLGTYIATSNGFVVFDLPLTENHSVVISSGTIPIGQPGKPVHIDN